MPFPTEEHLWLVERMAAKCQREAAAAANTAQFYLKEVLQIAEELRRAKDAK